MDNETTMMSVRVNKKLKKEADSLFKDLGLNTSAAINIFLAQCVCEESIPFEISKKPSNKMKNALKELEDWENGKVKLKGYHDVDELIKDCLK